MSRSGAAVRMECCDFLFQTAFDLSRVSDRFRLDPRRIVSLSSFRMKGDGMAANAVEEKTKACAEPEGKARIEDMTPCELGIRGERAAERRLWAYGSGSFVQVGAP